MVTKTSKSSAETPSPASVPPARKASPRKAASQSAASASKRSTDANRPTALITGASSGIGEALAHCFAQAGHDLILVARSADKLEALAAELQSSHGVNAIAEASDLSVAGAAAKLSATLAVQKRTVDVLVNCAGVLEQGAFLSIDAAKHQQIIDLNITGVTSMLTAFLPGMVAGASASAPKRVLNVASIAAFQPIPMLASYAASKAYVLSLSESRAEELHGTGVTVTALCPGVTATHMLTSAANDNDRLSKKPAFMIVDVNAVARQGFEACQNGRAICVPGAVNQVTTLASRATPKWLVRKIGGLMGRKAL